MTRSRPESQSSFRQPVETVKAPCTSHFYYSTEFCNLTNKLITIPVAENWRCWLRVWILVYPNYVDAATQPTSFKVYPRFYRRLQLNRNNPIHTFLWLTSAITWKKIYQDSPYKLRVNPSAGALYPTGIYVQIRGLEGIINGIYHIEVENNCLTLIYELGDDGLDNYVIPNKCINGFIFLVSCVYHRSSWKYQDRSLRYCLLDSGHHLGAIAAFCISSWKQHTTRFWFW